MVVEGQDMDTDVGALTVDTAGEGITEASKWVLLWQGLVRSIRARTYTITIAIGAIITVTLVISPAIL